MIHTPALRRLLTSVTLGTFALGLAPSAIAQESTATLELRPHCEESEELPPGFGGPIPDSEYMTGPATGGRCSSFPIKDPMTRETVGYAADETIDMDLVVRNPGGKRVSAVRAWIAYDPALLEGTSIEVEKIFPVVTPGESDFSGNDGYIKIGASTTSVVSSETVRVARIRMRAKAPLTAPSTILSFYDVGTGFDNHSVVLSGGPGQEQGITAATLGSLLVNFQLSGNAAPDPSASSFSSVALAPASSAQSVAPAPAPVSSSSEAPPPAPAPAPASSAPSPAPVQASSIPTIFGLLQVQNLRATTEGSSVFLAWDVLPSQELSGYNVYYGTVSGQYLQRRSVEKASTTLTIRALPEGVTYYFAVRAVSGKNVESDFSREVAITVGDPRSSTSPLVGNVTQGPGKPPKTSGSVAGQTGSSSLAMIVVLASAMIGTFFAFRRQLAAAPASHRS